MTVAAILRSKGRQVETTSQAATLLAAVGQLRQHGIGALVVVDGAKQPVGVLSERDIVRRLGDAGAAALTELVGSVMSAPVVTCSETDTVDRVMSLMTQRRFRHVPVVDNGQLVGIVSIGDVVKHKIAETEMEAAAMRAYITTG